MPRFVRATCIDGKSMAECLAFAASLAEECPLPEDDVIKSTPPYMPFRTFTNLLSKLEAEGAVPSHIDRSILTNMSNGTATQVLAGLKSLGLISEEGAVSEQFRAMALRSETRPKVLAEVLRERYPGIVDKLESGATPNMVQGEFKSLGIGGSTLRKAMAFFLKAAEFSDISIPPGFKIPSNANGSGSSRPRRPKPTQSYPADSADPSDRQTASEPPTRQAGFSDHVTARYPQAIAGVLEELPAMENPVWTATRRDRFIQAITTVIDLCYEVRADDRDAERGADLK